MALSISDVTAGRYARALIDVASENGLADRCLEDLLKFETAVQGEQSLFGLFDNPTVPVRMLSGLVIRLGELLGLHEKSTAFLSILANRRRLGGISSIIELYRHNQDLLAGRASGTIRSVGQVSDVQADEIARAIGKKVGKQLKLTREIDDSLLGGLQVTVKDMVYDLSTRTYLNSLRDRLLQNR